MPVNPGAYERKTLAAAEETLRRMLLRDSDEFHLREIRLEGRYYESDVVVERLDTRGRQPRKRNFRAPIWGLPNWSPQHSVYEPPERAGLDIAIPATGR